MIDKIYCISLKDESLRRDLMIKQLDNFFPNKYQIFDAVNYKDLNGTLINLVAKNTSIYKLSQIAISLSHYECVKLVYESKSEYAAIIEDDIRITRNFNEKFKKYIDSTLHIITKQKPIMIHLSGPHDKTEKLYKFIKSKDIINSCFYIINRSFAKLFLENFFPIKYQVDTYINKLSKKFNIIEYVPCPLLSWDLSSTMYENWWSLEDLEIHNKICSLSSKINFDKKSVIPYYKFNYDDTYSLIYSNYLKKNKIKIQKITKSTNSYYTTPNKIDKNSIVTGFGIKNIDEEIKINNYILFVRGPITREKLIKLNYMCPEIYLEPLMLCGRHKSSSNDSSIVITEYSEKNLNLIFKNNTIKTNIYEYVVVAISSYKKVIILEGHDFIQIKDFLLGFDHILKNINKLRINHEISIPKCEILKKIKLLKKKLNYLA